MKMSFIFLRYCRFFLIICLSLFLASCFIEKDRVELVLDSQSALGEGAVWNHVTGELLWVNISGKILNFYNPNLNFNKEMLTGQMIGAAVPSESGAVIVALENGFYYLDLGTGTKHLIVNPEDSLTENRFNDGKCDPAGRFWAGTMSLSGKNKAGALYRLDPDSTVHKMIEGVSTSNGIAWSLNNKRMYYIDTPTQNVTAFDYNIETGDVYNPQIVIEVPPELGSPDG